MIDLRPQDTAIIKDILQTYIPDAEVLAFGSRINQKSKDTSDLDLAVVGREKVPSATMAKLILAFQESDLPMRVDVLDWHRITPSMREEIKQGYEIIQPHSSMNSSNTNEY